MTECYFTPSKETGSATICANCGLEKSLHTIGEGIKANKSIIITESKIQYQMESRPCGSCIHFKKDTNANVMGICKKKLMTVVSNMKVAYKPDVGTCFE